MQLSEVEVLHSHGVQQAAGDHCGRAMSVLRENGIPGNVSLTNKDLME